MDEYLNEFSVENIQVEPDIFNEEKLLYINRH
jgi:hypothetical protein